METLSSYDARLQMFAEERRDAEPNHLRNRGWLAEHGALEHQVADLPSGRYAAPSAGPGGRW